MAEEHKQESSGLTTAIPVTVVLTILAGLLFTHSLPYQEERPSARPLQARYTAAQDVDARLWQDPFAAVEGASKKTILQEVAIRNPVTSPSHSAKQIYEGEILDKVEEIIVLAVSLPGGPYQDAAEQRMRWRYAVLSALANQKVVPQDEQHIGYFHPQPDSGLQKTVPFEWWLPSNNGMKKVLLLWLDELSLLKQPAAKISDLMNEVTEACNACRKNQIGSRYAVIGPNSSTLLRDMLKEVKGTVSDANCKEESDIHKSGVINGNKILYVSAAATASDEMLLQDIDQYSNNKKISKFLCDHGVTLYRTTATDRDMMNILVEELLLRHVIKKVSQTTRIKHWLSKKLGLTQDERDGRDQIIILSEWDTFYGRAMPHAFEEALSQNVDKLNAEGGFQIKKPKVRQYSYMRGLDGKLPDQNGNGDSVANKKTGDGNKSHTEDLIELPEGQNQKDYLRRMANALRELDNDKGVAAIGVLGSDVHDKLMIMEALRQNFPHKLFFTTDLDAIYSHPTKWPQTHNLLVTSAFDLKLRDALQDTIPPFRDSYQTAFFLAAQMIMIGMMDNKQGIANQIETPPLLFEIGRSRPIPLTTQKANMEKKLSKIMESQCSSESWRDCNYKIVQPQIVVASQMNLAFEDLIFDVLIIVMVIMLLSLVSWQVRAWVKSLLTLLKRRFKSYTVGAAFVGIAFVVLMYYLFFWWNSYIISFDAEPFYWLEGVSTWPSQLMRLAALAIAFVFFKLGRMRIRKMQKGVTEMTFALPADPYRLESSAALFVGSWKKEDENPNVSPNILWRKYLGYCRQRSFCRVMIHGLVFFLIALFVIWRSGFPNVPVRGDFAMYINSVVLFLSVTATLLLTMWVVENARLCEKFIGHLSAKPSQWNKNAREWAIGKKKVAVECVEEWLDIQLVALLTETIQPLIWGPMVCIGLLVLARSPATDDWDIPWGLSLVFIVMLIYTISAEIFLQISAKSARAKAIERLSLKIRAKRNMDCPEETGIKRIEAEIEGIKTLRQGALRPWYEWPLLKSIGGLSTLMVVLTYLADVWRTGTF